MKISNSKKQLAKIISENGGWCRNTPAICAVQARKHGTVMFAAEKPKRRGDSWFAGGFGFVGAMYVDVLLPNWHQTILSRDEYFFLYQNQGLEDALDEPVQVVEAKPTIEQLATDYRNAKDYAERKQQEADAAKADAEAKLAELVAAGKAFGLAVSVAVPEPKPELVITDWRDLQVGDIIRTVPYTDCDNTPYPGGWAAMNIDKDFAVLRIRDDGAISIDSDNPMTPIEETDNGVAFKFIRRPAKEAQDA